MPSTFADGVQALTLVVVTLALFVYGAQFLEMHRSRQSQSLLQLIQFLQDPGRREARGRLINVLYDTPFSKWEDPDKFTASTVFGTYDVAAILIRTKAVMGDPIERDWGNSIVKCYQAGKPFLDDMRKDPSNSRQWDDFETLALKIMKRFPDVGFRRPPVWATPSLVTQANTTP